MSTETESASACLGWQCLMPRPENPDQAGWNHGYCPDCQDELARDEIRAERQEARNEVERPTLPSDRCSNCGGEIISKLCSCGTPHASFTPPAECETPITDDDDALNIPQELRELLRVEGETAIQHSIRLMQSAGIFYRAKKDLERQLAESQHQVAKYAAEAQSAIKENERLFSQLAEARQLAEDAVSTCRVIKDKYGLGDRHVMREKNAEIETLKSQLAEANKARDDYFAAWTTCLRKRGELKEKLAEARADLSEQEGELNDLKIELSAMQEQRDKLAEALRWLDRWMGHKSLLECANKVRQALAALDRKEAE